MVASLSASAQSLDERLDQEKFLRGLSEYRLPEVLEHYMEEHPPADTVQATLYQITLLRMRAGDDSLAPEARRAAIDALLARREQLIDGHPMHPAHPVWLADQAADLFFAVYPLEAAGIACEFGLVAPDQRAKAAAIAAEIDSLASQAELEIEEAILNLEGEPGYQDDIALQLQRRRMAREERDRRIPFLRGVGEYLATLYAEDMDSMDQRAAWESAADTLARLVPELEGIARIKAQLYAGLALARSGRFDEAEEHFRIVAENPESAPVDAFAARMGGVINREISRGPAAAIEALASVLERYASPQDLFFRVLIADRRLITRQRAAEDLPQVQREQELRFAFHEYLNLLNDPAAEEMGTDLLRAIVYAKLANAADADAPVDSLPPIVLIARAENLAREFDTRPEAIQLFKEALQREDLDEQAKAAALFGLARAHFNEEDWLEAARRFDQVARETPGDPQAPKAMEIAASLLADLHAKAPEAADVTAQLDRTLQLALDQYESLPSIERWRFEMARLEFERRDLAAAEARLRAISAESSEWLDSRAMLARIARERAREAEAPGEAHEHVLAVSALARGEIEQALEDAALPPERVRALQDHLAFLDVFEAEALLALDRPDEALQRLAHFSGDSDVARGALADALSLRIAAYQATGRLEEARAEVGRFIESIPDRVDAVVPAIIAAIGEDIQAMIRRGDTDRARDRAASELIPLAQALTDWLENNSPTPERRVELQLQVARAYRLAERHEEAVRSYQEILALEPDLLEAIFGRAEALFGLARYEEAILDYKRISAARLDSRDEYYWRSELRMLQTLDRAGRNTHQIIPRIHRLRAIDPSLGGLHLDFAVLENRYAR